MTDYKLGDFFVIQITDKGSVSRIYKDLLHSKKKKKTQ